MEILTLELDALDTGIPLEELAFEHRGLSVPEDRIALLTWPSVYSDQWSTAEAVVRDNHVGGVILMKPSNAFAAELATRLSSLDALSHGGLLVATDEEGGVVQRLKALGALDSQETLSQRDVAAVSVAVRAHAKVIAAAGIDVVLGR